MTGRGRRLTKDELYEADFPWTIVDGHVYAIGSFLPVHPGGLLINRAVGEDATALFHVHHSGPRAAKVLRRYEIGHLVDSTGNERSFQKVLNSRIAGLEKAPKLPLAEAVAAAMLCVFAVWAWLSYVEGWFITNVAWTWFFWRHMDSGLHSAVHGDFRHSTTCQRLFFHIYSALSHHSREYYYGEGSQSGMGMSNHFKHHIYTNEPGRDPDWISMSSEGWVRRHWSSRWRPFHRWQPWYWLLVAGTFESALELLSMAKTCIDAIGALLEPPTEAAGPLRRRLTYAGALILEALLGPGYQGAAFFFQPWWRALGVLLLSRAVSRIILFPFSEVQHYMPDHMPEVQPRGTQEEWAICQLRTTANLKLGNPLAELVDFLMFHGDSYQVEHHLWPAMSFVNFRRASVIVKATCKEFGLPYNEVGYWEGYAKIWSQVCVHSMPSQEGSALGVLHRETPEPAPSLERSDSPSLSTGVDDSDEDGPRPDPSSRTPEPAPGRERSDSPSLSAGVDDSDADGPRPDPSSRKRLAQPDESPRPRNRRRRDYEAEGP